MTAIKRNVFANVAGKAWSAVLALAVVPLYLRFLGIEAYGLIGFYISLSTVLSLLDLGLGTALNRRLAQYSVDASHERDMRNLVRSLEIIYWSMGIALGAAVALVAPWFASHWLQLSKLTPESAGQVLMLMGIAIGCQWPRTLYSGGLQGLQRLVALNAISSTFATVQNLGAVIVLWKVSNSLQAFMLWHIAVGLMETLVTGRVLWQAMPEAKVPARFDITLLRGIWRFAAGMAGISATSVVLTQLDKVILSRLLPLEAYGYYTLAWRVAGALYYLVAPLTAAFFPRFSQLVAMGDHHELVRLYHRSCQLMSVLLLPVVAVLALFPQELLLLWTRDAVTAANSSALVSLLVVGTALNGLMNLPLAIQLAHGGTRLVLYANVAAVLVLAPLIYYMTIHYGGFGAALVWCVLNAGYVVFLLRAMHRRVLPDELRPWYITDTGGPLAAAFLAAALYKFAVPAPDGMLLPILHVGVAWAAAGAAALMMAPQMRALAVHRLGRMHMGAHP